MPLQSPLPTQLVFGSSGRPTTAQALMGGYRSPFATTPQATHDITAPTASRTISMQRNRGRVTSAGGSHFGRRNPRALLGQENHGLSQPLMPASFEAYIAIFPLAIYAEDQVGVADGEEFTETRLVFPNERIESCLTRFKEKNLLAPINIPSNNHGDFFEAWDSQIRAYMQQNHCSLPAESAHGSPFEKKPYRILVPYRSRGEWVLEKPKTTLTARSFTASTLSKTPFGTIPNTVDNNSNCKIYFIAPVGGNLMGWIDRLPGGQGIYGSHRCIGQRFYQGWEDSDFSQGELAQSNIKCFQDCMRTQPTPNRNETDDEDNGIATLADLSAIPATFPPSDGAPQEPFSPDSDDDIARQEEEMLQAAIRESQRTHFDSSQIGEGSSSRQQPIPSARPGTLNRELAGGNGSQLLAQPQTPCSTIQAVPVVSVRAPNTYVADTTAVQDFFSSLDERIPAPVGRTDKLKFTLTNGTTTVEHAAAIFLNYLTHFTAKQFQLNCPVIDVELDWSDVIETAPDSITGLVRSDRHSWKVGMGIGDGVRNAVLDGVMNRIFKNPLHFAKNEKTDNYMLSLPHAYSSISSSTGLERRLQLMTSGLFTAIYLILNRKAPPLLSGILVHAILNGYNSIDEDELLRHLCSDFREEYLRLKMLALDEPIKVGSSTQYLVEIALETTICNLEGPPNHGGARSPEYHKAICQSVLGYYLLGTSRAINFDDHPDVRAFAEGLNIPLKDGVGFGKLLKGQSVALFPGLWCREISSSEILLQHLCISALVDEDHDPRPLSSAEAIISDAIKRYLGMAGHPDCPGLRAILPGEWFDNHKHDTTIRSRLFLQAATGSSATPTDSEWTIKIELARDNGKGPETETPRPLEWHLCARSVTLWYDQDLVNACLEPIPEHNPTFSRRFDGWFHSQVVYLEGSSGFSMV